MQVLWLQPRSLEFICASDQLDLLVVATPHWLPMALTVSASSSGNALISAVSAFMERLHLGLSIQGLSFFLSASSSCGSVCEFLYTERGGFSDDSVGLVGREELDFVI